MFKLPQELKSHTNVSFVRFYRRSNYAAAKKVMDLKGGANSKTLLMTTLDRTIRGSAPLFDDIDPVEIFWSERFSGNANNMLVFEHGWLPRVSYQMSPQGANARSHVVYQSSRNYFDEISEAGFDCAFNRAQRFITIPQTPLVLDGVTDEAFCLVPLQGGLDYNLKFSESGFDHLFGQSDANQKFAQALVDRVAAENPGVRVVVTEHPAKKCRLSSNLSLPDNVILIRATQGVKSIDLASHPNCQGVVSVNSNMMHESMLLNKKVCGYGRLMYGQHDKPVYSTMGDMLNDAQANYEQAIRNYLSMLFLYQWELTDFMDPHIVRAMLVNPLAIVPWHARSGRF